MEIKSVSVAIFAATNATPSKVFAVSNIKSVNGEVVTACSLYAAKQYGSDIIVQTVETCGEAGLQLYSPQNVAESENDAIALALNTL